MSLLGLAYLGMLGYIFLDMINSRNERIKNEKKD